MEPEQKESYDHKAIEKKWQEAWENQDTYTTEDASDKPKMYVLDMFPYPSGAGLHVGHPRGYIGSDVYARMKRMQGFNVLHPMGYDAFGLPAEQYAIQHKIHPAEAVAINVQTFEQQLSIIGLSYDWSRKVNTTDPAYYKWTQWIFLKLYEHYYDTDAQKAVSIATLVSLFETEGNASVHAHTTFASIFSADEWHAYSKKEQQDILMHYRIAYEGESEVNWCEELGTVLANDEIVDGPDGTPVSERGGYPVVKKTIMQWFMRITAYADRLLAGLETLDWPEHIKEIQKNWIGKSEGSEIDFPMPGQPEHPIRIFTTRADTIYGATFVAISAGLAQKWIYIGWKASAEIDTYIQETLKEEHSFTEKEKTGIYAGFEVMNPATKELIPVWITNYVLDTVGTGAIMGVPARDERDRAFAEKYNLPIIDTPFVDKEKITTELGGELLTRYKMRDAIFARQRYWGEPIPLRRDADGIIHEVTDLPLELPNVTSYEPTGSAEGPLAGVKEWKESGYEANTMPGWAGSSWYFLRYMDPNNSEALASKESLDYWKNVDVYVGGQEHATGHLLYSRFWHKFLKDIGVVETEEPFQELHNQGLILASDGRKMSKRWGNVVNPDEIVKFYGADTLRVYEMFMGPFTEAIAWDTTSIIGPRRFLENKVWRIARALQTHTYVEGDVVHKVLHKTVKKVSDDIATFSFNTAVSALMIFTNAVLETITDQQKTIGISTEDFKSFLKLLAPFAPHITEELWQELGEKESIHLSLWPTYDESKLTDDTVTIGVQVNGKVRAELTIASNATKESMETEALALPRIIEFLNGQPVKKVIIVPGRIINVVV